MATKTKKLSRPKQPTEFKCTLKIGGFVKKVKMADIYPRYEDMFLMTEGFIKFTFKLEKFDIKKKTASYVLEDIK
jgi:hypothetical protein